MESTLNIDDLRKLQQAFHLDGNGYGNHLSLNRAQFCEALILILKKGSKEEYEELFDKIDATKEGLVDWDKFASFILLNFYERDDRTKSTQIPQWKELRSVKSPHKDIIQRVIYMKNAKRYMTVSKEGAISLWDNKLKIQKTIKLTSDSCNVKDLWITGFVPLYGSNKIALSLTSKEIAVYELNAKLEFHCLYRIHGLEYSAICLDYWCHPENANDSILTWGDTGGGVTAIQFTSACTTLFERQSNLPSDLQETCFIVQLKDIAKGKFKNASLLRHQGHSEWVRQVCYSSQLECFISCSTVSTDSLILAWVGRSQQNKVRLSNISQSKDLISSISRVSTIQISQGINGFDYHKRLNLIATAGVNSHVCLWNPYVVSKPAGVLRGHMASVTQVCFIRSRGQLVSFSKDKVLRIWDVPLQICIQRVAGIFPKLADIYTFLYFDERFNRLFLTFNADLTYLELKPEVKDRALSHEAPVVGAFYCLTYFQVVSASEAGVISIWMLDTSQKVKQWADAHGSAKLTTLAQDHSETRIVTGAADGTIKIWDYNGHCHHLLQCKPILDQPADIGQIISLKRSILAVGWAKYLTIFRDSNFQSYHVEASEWKGGQEHADDILSIAFDAPNSVASGSYSGEIIVWNNVSELASRRLLSRTKQLHRVRRQSVNHVVAGSYGGDAWTHERPVTRSKSRAASRISLGGSDEMNEFGYAVTCLAFLTGRAAINSTSAANLVSCGGNGWVRFWHTPSSQLMGEYVAHLHAGSIVMAVDKITSRWLATGDVDGVVKVWDISSYCIEETGELCTSLPRLELQMQLHQDIINSLEICVRNERTLIISTSADCTVQLLDVTTKTVVGTFGQETHWRIDPITFSEEVNCNTNTEEEENDNLNQLVIDVDWQPDPRAVDDPLNYRINTWQTTYLGKEYQKLRMSKRERRQPQKIPDLPYLHWEKTRQRPSGPHAALQVSDLNNADQVGKPDFFNHPHRYFSERLPPLEAVFQPDLANTLLASFDEKTVFPKYVLDFEVKVRQTHEKINKHLSNTQSTKHRPVVDTYATTRKDVAGAKTFHKKNMTSPIQLSTD